MTTLLEKAKSIVRHRVITPDETVADEEVELIEAYFKNEITVRQASEALGHKHPGNFTAWLGAKLKKLYRQGQVQITKSKD
jgi:hypothetical protein